MDMRNLAGSTMRASVTNTCMIAGILAAVAAHAETFYEQDGITLEGTARIVTREAGACRVSEEHHAEAVYERTKANHGQPLHVWQLDFSARNGSGRPLSYLRAHFNIESEWPPCTNWSGPSGSYSDTVQWASSFQVLQMPYGMEPDQEVSDTIFLLVFHDQRPRFESWDIDYRFAAGTGAGRSGADRRGGSSGREGAPEASAGQLPPDIMADRHLLKAEQSIRDGDLTTARAAMERVVSLQEEHGLEPAPEDHFRYAEAWQAAGAPERALESAVRYLQLQGREAEHYTEALELMNRAEAGKSGARAGVAGVRRVQPGAPQSPRGPERTPARPPVPRMRAAESREFDGMEFAWIPAGEFRMGSTSSDADDDEQPVTRVRISRGFWLGKHEVTQAEWQAVMGTNPSLFSGCGRCPVERVSWDDAQAFIGRLNARGGGRYRLPTEAEWEYAARAGTSGDRYGGDLDAIAWHDRNSGTRTHSVGQKAPNAFGLHDMLGNVWEWVQDWYGGYPGGSVTDPSPHYSRARAGRFTSGALTAISIYKLVQHRAFCGFRPARTDFMRVARAIALPVRAGPHPATGRRDLDSASRRSPRRPPDAPCPGDPAGRLRLALADPSSSRCGRPRPA